MAQIEEITSEDLGFKLACAGEGVKVFEEAVDFEKYAGSRLNLLAIANEKKLIAASNTRQLILGNLDELSSLNKLDIDGITQIFFNYNETKLLINLEGKLVVINVDNYLQGDNSITEIDQDVTWFTPSRFSNDILILKGSNLHINDKIIQDVAVCTWGDDLYYYITNDQPDKIQSSDGKSIPINSEILDKDFIPQDMIYLCKNKFFLVYESVESDLQDHEIESFINDSGTMINADLAPPFGFMGRVATYYSTSLFKWIPNRNFSILTSSCSSDINLISLTPLESIGQSEDTNRAQFPLDDGDDTTAIGFALDLTQTNTVVKQPVQGVEEAIGKLPLLYALLNTGNLISWWIFDKTELINNNIDLNAALKEDTKYNNAEQSKRDTTEKDSNSEDVIQPNPFTKADPFSKNNQQESKFKTTSGFGQTSFGTSGTGAFGLPDTKQSGSKDGFGSFGFKNTQTTGPIQSNESSSTFGKTGFGANTLSAQPLFTQPSSGSGFGQTSFGQQKQAGSSVFGGSGFGKSTVTSGFAKMATNTSGFGSLASGKSDSPFAKLSGGNKESSFDIFSKQPKSENIFAAEESGTFGQKLNQTKPAPMFSQPESEKSSFDLPKSENLPTKDLDESQSSSFALGDLGKSLNSTMKEDAAIKPDLSPFGTFGKQPTDLSKSPFSNIGKFGNQAPVKDVNLKSESESPFAKFAPSAKVETESPFSKFAPSTKVETESPFSKSSEKVETESPFSKFAPSTKVETESPFSKFAPSAKVETESPFSKFAPSTKVETESPFSKFAPSTKVETESPFSKFAPSAKVETNSPFSSTIKSTESSFAKLGTSEKPSVLKSDKPIDSVRQDSATTSEIPPSLNTQDSNILEQSLDAKSMDVPSSLGKSEKENKAFSNETFEAEAKHLNESNTGVNNAEIYVDADVDEENSLGDSNESKQDEEIIDIELLNNREPKPETTFFSYDGTTIKKSQITSKIGQQILTIINETSGQLTVLEKNIKILQNEIDYEDGLTTSLTFDALQLRDKWILSDDPMDLIESMNADLNDYITEIDALPSKLENIINRIEDNQTSRIKIDQLFNQLHTLTSANSTKRLQNRKLDLPNLVLRTNLRTKLANITQKEEELRKKLMALKAKQSSTAEMVSNLESVILQLNGNIHHHLDHVNDLSLQVENLTINEKSPHLITNSTQKVVSTVKSRWSFAKNHTQNSVIPKKVQFIK